MTRFGVWLCLFSACPPGLGTKTVSCVVDAGALSNCFEWTGGDAPHLGAIEATCARFGTTVATLACPADLRVVGCRTERPPVTETRWYRSASYEVLVACPDAGRTVVSGEETPDAGADDFPDGGRCSGPAVTATSVIFTNAGNSTVYLVWVTQSCTEVSYGPIPPGGGINQPTYLGHVWRLRRDTSSGPLIREFAVSGPNASVLVR